MMSNCHRRKIEVVKMRQTFQRPSFKGAKATLKEEKEDEEENDEEEDIMRRIASRNKGR